MQAAKTSHVRNVAVPLVMYGTAWKEDRTQALVLEAIATGFRAFDTANPRKNDVEKKVGAAVRAAISYGTVTPENFFLQINLNIHTARSSAHHTILIAISP